MARTQLRPGALPSRRYGSFSHAPPAPDTRKTRLGSWGVPARRCGAFAGKTPGGGGFPTQYAGLRVYAAGGVVELCLVALADAPGGMGGQVRIYKDDVRAVYLVETTDPNASPVRVRTATGTKAMRLRT